jgi:hypothetical protein
MKLLQFAAVLLVSCAAFAQANVQCVSFPCVIPITSAQCPSGLPCSLTVTTGIKFKVGDKVFVTHIDKVAVRTQAALSAPMIGTQPYGRTGMVVGGPVTDTAGDNKIRWQIDFAVGVDGWAVQDYLEKSAIQPATSKFIAGDRVTVLADGVSVRSAPFLSATLLGKQSAGALGTVVAGPNIDPADGLNRYNVNFDSGADGWAGDQYLTKSSIPVPVAKSVTLKWFAPATDGAASYNLYRSGVKIGSVSGSSLTFTNTAVPSGTYSYSARTVDAAGHESVDSNVVSVTIP